MRLFIQKLRPKPYSILLLCFTICTHYSALAFEDQTMHERANDFFGTINNYWGGFLFWQDHPLKLPLILVFMISGGLFFTCHFGFVNVRLFKHAFDVIRGKFDMKEDKGEITHFQALTSALSATVGLGNIAGVAIAISLGGPGAVFWLWVVAFFGMSMKFSSCTLAQLYRVVHPDGKVIGGPMIYLDKGFKENLPKFSHLGKTLAFIFAFFTIAASLGGGNMFQGNQSFELLVNIFPALQQADWIVGLILAFLVGIVIIGGIQRIGEVTSKLVPAMCAFYCGSCLVIIFGHLEAVPGIFQQIFIQAFQPEAIWTGGFIGVLTQGVKRASFSNEAGLGSTAIAHAAAKTDRPVREGVVAMIEPFIDTHIVCTMTSLAILITNAHLDLSLSGKGAAITAKAFSTIGSSMPLLLTIAVVIFAYSTMISWCYYGEKATEYLGGRKFILPYRIFYVTCVALGPILSLGNVLNFSDLMLLSMAFPNIIGMFMLSNKTKHMIVQYKGEYTRGEMKPVK